MVEDGSFKKKVIDGFIWLGTGTFLGQAISWLSTIIIIRLLQPSDYGLMAMATTFVALLTTVGELGIGASIIQADKINENDVRLIQGVVLVTSIFGLIICYLAAPAIAYFYADPRLIPIIRIMGVVFLLVAFYAIPQSLIVRHMNFRLKAKVDIFAQVGAALLTLFLAVQGHAVWSLVVGFLSLHFFKAIGFNLTGHNSGIPKFGYSSIKRFINFGVTVTGDRLLYNLYIQVDKIIVGKFLGGGSLGIYAVASNLSSIPSEKILPIITQVTFTSYSRIQNDLERIRRNILKTIRAIAYPGFPIFFGMAAVAPEGIPLILGSKWANIVVPFQMFCMVMPLKSLSTVLPPAIFAVGKPKINLVNMIINLVVMSVAFTFGVSYGINGVCLMWVLAFPIVFLITCARSLKVIEMRLSTFLLEMKFPLILSILMFAFISIMRALFQIASTLGSLIIFTVLGAAFYFILIIIFDREGIIKFKEQILTIK